MLRKLVLALRLSADVLIFEEKRRGPEEELRMQFEAFSRFDAAEKKVIRALLEGMILKHEVKRWSSSARGHLS